MAQPFKVSEFLKNAVTAAHHFGFEHVDTLANNAVCKECTLRREHKANAAERKIDALGGLLTNGMCAYLDNKLHAIEGPVLFYTIDTMPRTNETALTFQILNVEKSIAEALLIETMRSILKSAGFGGSSVRINSLGDQDSSVRYTRELTNFLKKRLEEMPPQARELMKEHAALALMHLIEKEHDLGFRSPSPLEYLSDASRKHFREVVEYLDMSATPYEIDAKLMGHHHCYSETIFSFDLRDENDERPETEPLMVRGGRYNAFTSRMVKGGVPASGAVIVVKNQPALQNFPRFGKPTVPSVSIVQLGFGPKIRSLMMLDELRQAGIPVAQDLVSDSLSSQLRRAEERNTRFAVIIGQKEFVEKSAIIRDLHSRSQETIPMSGLVNYLKRVA